ncbi:MAG: ATP-binding protein [Spirochaetales bacterium]|nr:ATP-binding protein [Spirochaetales bacterium]
MYQRIIGKKILSLARKFPVITLSGPRQSGKTFLLKYLLSELEYRSLEDPDTREFALEDPRGFLKTSKPMIIDEIQKAPALFSYIQGIVDTRNTPGFFYLSGSENFLLMEKISQSLAGRTAILHLLPLSMAELNMLNDSTDCLTLMLKGGYPRPWDVNIEPMDFYPSYVATYLERDIRSLTAVHDITRFQRFLKLCAARTGQELNLSALALDTGVTYNTIASWLSVLETSFIIFRLPPYHSNFKKRLIKNSKLYFHDTGLACYLLGIRKEEDLDLHSLKGALFENFVLSETFKTYSHCGIQPPLYFWRDHGGHEIDMLIEDGQALTAVEIKAGQTPSGDQGKNLIWFSRLTPLEKSYVVNAGSVVQERSTLHFIGWAAFLRELGERLDGLKSDDSDF